MYDEEFENDRAKVLNWAKNKIETILNAWCDEAGIKEPIGYYVDYTNNVIEIYSSRLGYLIGVKGTIINKFRETIKKEYGNGFDFKLIEIRGGMANYKL